MPWNAFWLYDMNRMCTIDDSFLYFECRGFLLYIFFQLNFNQIALKKIDQNHAKTICWKCDGFVMVLSWKTSRKPSLFIKTIWWLAKSSGFKKQNFWQTIKNHNMVLIYFFQCSCNCSIKESFRFFSGKVKFKTKIWKFVYLIYKPHLAMSCL